MYNTLMTGYNDERLRHYAQVYGEFMYTHKTNEDKRGWIKLAETREIDVAYILSAMDWDNTMGGQKILELGARGSAFSGYISERAGSVVVSDNFQRGQCDGHIWRDWDNISDYGDVTKWDRRWREIAICPDKITSLKIDMQDIPYPDKTFDYVISISAMEHATSDIKAMLEMKRVVKDDGWIVLTTDFNQTEVNTPVERRYTGDSFVALVHKVGLNFIGEHNYDTSNVGFIGGCAVIKKYF